PFYLQILLGPLHQSYISWKLHWASYRISCRKSLADKQHYSDVRLPSYTNQVKGKTWVASKYRRAKAIWLSSGATFLF
ncbi:unnamed protein product, partial [Musa hybrid cultivar]